MKVLILTTCIFIFSIISFSSKAQGAYGFPGTVFEKTDLVTPAYNRQREMEIAKRQEELRRQELELQRKRELEERRRRSESVPLSERMSGINERREARCNISSASRMENYKERGINGVLADKARILSIYELMKTGYECRQQSSLIICGCELSENVYFFNDDGICIKNLREISLNELNAMKSLILEKLDKEYFVRGTAEFNVPCISEEEMVSEADVYIIERNIVILVFHGINLNCIPNNQTSIVHTVYMSDEEMKAFK